MEKRREERKKKWIASMQPTSTHEPRMLAVKILIAYLSVYSLV